MKKKALLIVVVTLAGVVFGSLSLLLSNRILIHVAAYSNTEYAEAYQEDGFQTITLGSSAEKVKSILGEPLWIEDGSRGWMNEAETGVEVWSYSKAKEAYSYVVRDLTIDRDSNTVINKRSEIYWD